MEQALGVRDQPESFPPFEAHLRPAVKGKFLWIGEEKFYVRGVTYGPFRPDAKGKEFHNQPAVEQDFAQIAANGFNTIRFYTTPPRRILDTAQRHGLRAMVCLTADRYIGFLTDKKGAPDIEELVRAKVRGCAGHPAVLCYALGNEIPAPVARWHGRRTVERYLARLYRAVRSEDRGALVTYVNYPSTEYLQLPFLDFVCFNVYLESRDRFAAYLARLQNLAGDRPLLMGEIGLDSLRHGHEVQARALQWLTRTAFACGCAGAFVYSWTDEWYNAGRDVDDWEFGITRRDRTPKPALAAVRDAFAEVPFPRELPWPSMSVVVCTHNGGRTMRDCCEGLRKLEYPRFEVIVVNDGSTDETAEIVREYGFRLINTENCGLSNARNTGREAATGEIIAYLDDDARPDPQWLTYLASAFLNTAYAAVGGPNIAPPGDGPIADCVAHAPGGPVHVLLSDLEAEHIPGCNMAFRKTALEAVGGFDPQFRVAGDDVDVCWRLQQHGFKLGFSPGAMVWHHRRNSVRAYWRQQKGYGRAEALLEAKWPEKYNAAGHVTWGGRVYGNGHTKTPWLRCRVYQGTWGSAPFQSLYQPAPGTLWSLFLMPEWYLCVISLAALAALGGFWKPLDLALPVLIAALGAAVFQAGLGGIRASFASATRSRLTLVMMRTLTGLLHLLQPLGRLYGRLSSGLTPWRIRCPACPTVPWPRRKAQWSEHWRDPGERLRSIESAARAEHACVSRGGEFDRWDLEIRGILGAARLQMAVEEHGIGRQLVRFRVWPKFSRLGIAVVLLFSALAAAAGYDRAWIDSVLLGLIAAILAARILSECAAATGVFLRSLEPDRAAAGSAVKPALGGAGVGEMMGLIAREAEEEKRLLWTAWRRYRSMIVSRRPRLQMRSVDGASVHQDRQPGETSGDAG
jgi:GT2 family glycosyltransferase